MAGAALRPRSESGRLWSATPSGHADLACLSKISRKAPVGFLSLASIGAHSSCSVRRHGSRRSAGPWLWLLPGGCPVKKPPGETGGLVGGKGEIGREAWREKGG